MADSSAFWKAYEEARQKRWASKFKEAIDQYREAIELGKQYIKQWNEEASSNFFYRVAEFFVHTKAKVEDAVEQCSSSIQETYGEWGVFVARQGRFEEGLRLIESAGRPLESNTASVLQEHGCEIYRLWGKDLAAKRQFDEATGKIQAGLRMRPGHGALLETLADIYLAWGKDLAGQRDFGNAVTRLRESLKLRPGHAETVRCLVGSYVQWSKRLLEANDSYSYHRVIANLKEALQLQPRNPEATYLLAVTYLRLNEKSQEACKAVENAYMLTPDDRDIVIGLARIYLARKTPWETAEPVVYKAYTMSPGAEEFLIPLAVAYLDKGRRDEQAYGIYRRAYEAIPLWRRLVLALTDIYVSRSDNSPNAIKVLEESLRYEPENQSVVEFLADHYLRARQGRFAEVKVLQRAATWRLNDLDLFLYLGQILKSHGKNEKAALWYQQAISSDPNSVEGWVALGEIYANTKRHSEAIEACNRALALVPTYGSVYLMRGEVYRDLGEFEKAKADFERARQLDPLSREAYDRLGEIVASSGERRQAIAYYEHLLKVNPADADAAYKAGKICFAADNYSRAVEFLTQAVRIERKVAPQILLGRALLRSGNCSDAVDTLVPLLSRPGLTPDELKEVLFYAGLAYLRLRAFTEAIESFGKLLKLEEDHLPALINTGVAYAQGGDIRTGEVFFEKALDIDRYLAIGHTNLVLCLVKTGRISAAIELCLSEEFQQGAPATVLSMASSFLCRTGNWARMDDCAARLYRLYHDSPDDLKVAESSFLYGATSYLRGRPYEAQELLAQCQERLWGDESTDGKVKLLRTWAQGLSALTTYEISLDSDSIYDDLRACMDADSRIGDFVILKLCRALVRVAPQIGDEIVEIARGTRFGAQFASKDCPIDFPLFCCDEEFQVEQEASRYQDWLAVASPIEGGMATVTKVYNSKLKLFGARKQLKPGFINQSLGRNAFRKEAHFCAGLHHPNIVRVFPDSIDDRNFSFVMEWMDRGSLASLIKRGPISVAGALDIMIEAGKGLAFFHSLNKKNIHRDFTPGNILLDETGRVKVTDFGVANIEDDNRQFTVSEGPEVEKARIAGKYPYIAPEQWRGEELDQRADQYSFGVTLYEALTGQLPLKPENPGSGQGWIYVALEEKPRPPHELSPEVPQDLSEAVMRMLEKDPSSRFSSMDDVLTVLAGIRSRLGGGGGDDRWVFGGQ